MSFDPGQQATISATLRVAGTPIAIPTGSTVTAQLFAEDGTTPFGSAKSLASTTVGANWQLGLVVAEFSDLETAVVTGSAVLVRFVVTGPGINRSWTVRLDVADASFVKSALFPNRAAAIARFRQLLQFGPGASLGLDMSLLDTDLLWDMILAGESAIAGMLRVPLQPTRFFPREPTPEQIAALPEGMPWGVDPAYDYDPANFYGDKWGLIVTRQKPIQSIVGMKFVYPSPQQTIVDVPADWIRGDFKYGQIQLVPTGTPYQTLLGGLFLSQLSGGKTLPFTIDLDYVAGIKDAARQFPDLIDVVYKMAMCKVVDGGFLPQSGSISADGLSQSNSFDTGKHHEAIDRAINGPNGNGGLMVRINGVRAMVM